MITNNKSKPKRWAFVNKKYGFKDENFMILACKIKSGVEYRKQKLQVENGTPLGSYQIFEFDPEGQRQVNTKP